jgi:GNAT superfamily N-acetyltransferase
MRPGPPTVYLGRKWLLYSIEHPAARSACRRRGGSARPMTGADSDGASAPAGIEVRDATVDDVGDIAQLFAQLGYDVSAGEVAIRLAGLAGDPQSRCLVAADGTHLVGAITLYFVPVIHQGGRWCRLTSLVVDEQTRGRGVGQALVAAAEEASAAAGCVRVEATSATRRTDAHAFYERLRYRREALHFLKILDSG